MSFLFVCGVLWVAVEAITVSHGSYLTTFVKGVARSSGDNPAIGLSFLSPSLRQYRSCMKLVLAVSSLRLLVCAQLSQTTGVRPLPPAAQACVSPLPPRGLGRRHPSKTSSMSVNTFTSIIIQKTLGSFVSLIVIIFVHSLVESK